MIIVHEAVWALVAALLAYSLGRCATEPDLNARMASQRRWVGVVLKWFALVPVAWFVVVQLWIYKVLPRPSFTWHTVWGGVPLQWAFMAASLAYILGHYWTASDFSTPTAREPWRWLGLSAKWFSVACVAYALVLELCIHNLLPRPLRDQLLQIGPRIAVMPSVAYFIRFIVAWLKWRRASVAN